MQVHTQWGETISSLRLVKHARYHWLLLAEGHLHRQTL
jgi:hypothetical protein